VSAPAKILVVNAGSSSLKLWLLDDADEVLERLDLPPIDAGGDRSQIAEAVRGFAYIDAVGHRIVHGGAEFRASVLVTDEVVARLLPLSDLAPLHNPPALAALEAVRNELPGVPKVACFDTAFHATLS
jgi:acetate kinase